MKKGDFKDDSKIASYFERYVSDLLKDEGYCSELIEQSEGYVPEFDLKMYINEGDKLYEGKNELTFEVKVDYTKKDNIVFEYSSNDKNSCVSVTKSDYWVVPFYKLNYIWIFKTENLKKVIKYCKGEGNWKDENNNIYMNSIYGNNKKVKLYQFSKKDFSELIGIVNIIKIEKNMKNKKVDEYLKSFKLF